MDERTTYCMNCFTKIEDNADFCPHCGWKLSDQIRGALPYATAVGGKYLLGRVMRLNGSEIVYMAISRENRERVEVHEFFPNMLARRGGEGIAVRPVPGAEIKYDDYLAEYEALVKKLQEATGVKRMPRVLDFFSENNTVYMVQAYQESVSLQEYVERSGTLSWEDCEKLFFPVIHSLGTLHGKDIAHLGISPKTLKITPSGKMILVDFEIESVRRAETELIEDMYPGCWAYEQYTKTMQCDEVTDVYGMCTAILFALSGEVPMEATKRKKDPRLMVSTAVLKKLPEHVIPALANGLQVDAQRRTASFSVLAAELTAPTTVLENVVENETLRTLPTGKGKRPNAPSVPTFFWFILSFAVTIGAVLFVAGIWFPDSPFSPQSIMESVQEPQSSVQTTRIVTPNLVGQQYDTVYDLTQRDKDYSFTLYVYHESYSSKVPEGEIISQIPLAGDPLKVGDTVRVEISRGEPMRALPSLEGLTLEEAKQALTDAGFTPVAVYTTETEAAQDTVLGYSGMNTGDVMAHGSVATFLVSGTAPTA